MHIVANSSKHCCIKIKDVCVYVHSMHMHTYILYSRVLLQRSYSSNVCMVMRQARNVLSSSIRVVVQII